VDYWFDRILAEANLAPTAVGSLRDDGVGTCQRLQPEMLRADPDNSGISGSSTRVHDFVNRGEEFDQLYLHAPVFTACCLILEQPFKLSTMHARTVRPRTGPQTTVEFVVMVDEFRPENGATYFAPGSQGDSGHATLSNTLVPACGPVGWMIV
jgi:hypothetical protein